MVLTFKQDGNFVAAPSYQPLTEADIVTNIIWQGNELCV